MKLRGYAALSVTCAGLFLSDLVQRLIIAPWVRLQPSRRTPILGRWINLMAWLVTRPMRTIGGAHIPVPPRIIPSGPGVLVLMNHQSLFDIPLLVQAIEGGYPRIVTRKRYGRWIPLISHMTRLYQYPLVDPSAGTSELRTIYKELQRAANTSEVPIALFPEGSRTKDGQIAPFRRKGLALILRTRPWKIYVLVADGFWKQPRFKDFLSGMADIRGRVELAGTLEWTDPRADPEPFMDQVHRLMSERLSAMRQGGEAA